LRGDERSLTICLMDPLMDWISFYDFKHSVIYVNARHRDVHYRTIAEETRAYVPSPSATVLDYGCGEALSADLVAERLSLPNHTIAWQSAGRTSDPWWGPPIEDVLADLAREGHRAVVVCSAGFVADHLEILYDLDIELREEAERLGVRLIRTEMPNADPRYVAVLAEVVREHLAAEPVP